MRPRFDEPVFRSLYGLSLSLLERLSLISLYGRKEEHAETGHFKITDLIQPYSHCLLSCSTRMSSSLALPPKRRRSWLTSAGSLLPAYRLSSTVPAERTFRDTFSCYLTSKSIRKMLESSLLASYIYYLPFTL